MSECSDQEEVPPVVTLWGRQWSREELLARVGRLEQVAGMRTVEGQLRAPEEVSDGKR
jgi:hypothetical protein